MLLFADVVGYSRHSQWLQGEVQQELLACLQEASAGAGLDRTRWVRQGSGDGELAVLPVDEQETRVVGDLVRKLSAGLRRRNIGRQPEARLRVRFAIHFGPAAPAGNGFAGHGVIDVSRLVEAEVVKEVTRLTTSHLVVVVSDVVYQDTVLQQLTDFDPEEFRHIVVAHKEYVADAWLWTSDGKVHELNVGQSAGHAAPAGQAPALIGNRADLEPTAGRAFPKNNLPLLTDAFVGRSKDLGRARRLVLERRERLISVVGSPGVGKTRFAQQLARSLLDRFQDHAYFVDLSTIADPDLVINNITRALKVDMGDPVLEALKQLLQEVDVLLVLDSMERVLAVSTTIHELLDAAPGLHVLATSQEPMLVRGERIFQLDPMETDEAVGLFLERAGRSDEPAGAADPDVTTLCQRLDNLPLAIELVAARARFYTPAQLLRMLTEMPDVPATNRDTSERQRSLKSAFMWSYELLGPAEQSLFSRLAVFENGWTLESAIEILRREGEPDFIIADQMHSLLTKSLLQLSPTGNARCRMFRTLRPYAVELLQQDVHRDELRERHARHYLTLATGANDESATHLGLGPALLEAEQDNLSAALRYFIDRRRAREALELTLALSHYWWSRDYAEGWTRVRQVTAMPCPANLRDLRDEVLVAEGRLAIRLGRLDDAQKAFIEALAHCEGSSSRTESKAASGLALVAMERADFPTSRELLHRALVLQQEDDDRAGLADTLDGLGAAFTGDGEYEQAAVHLRDSLDLYESLPDTQGAAWVHNDLARLSLALGHADSAQQHATRALDAGVVLGDPGLVAWAKNYLGHAAAHRGEHAKARQYHLDSLTAVLLLGDKRPTALALEGLAALAAQQGSPGRAVALSEAALDVRNSAGVPRTVAEQHMMDGGPEGTAGVTWAYEQLTSAELSRATARGRGLSLEQAVGLARRE